MTIGIDASRAQTTHRTGTEWYSFHVIEELKKIIPSTHTVILYSKEKLTGTLGTLPPHWENRVLAWPLSFFWTQGRFSLEMLFRAPDVLLVPSHTLPLITPKKSIAVIHDVGFAHHDALYNQDAVSFDSSLKKRILHALVKIATFGKYSATEQSYHHFSTQHAKRHADAIVTVSKFSKTELMKWYHIPEERITVIHNGWNARNVTPEISYLQEIGSPYLFFIGRIEKKKNILTLIDAFALLRKKYRYHGKLVLAGSPGFGKEEIDARIAAHHLEDAVVQTGWVSEERAAALLLGATTFVFPSLYEGFGIPVLEAFSSNVPVVCSAIPALEEVTGNAALFFPPTDADALANALHRTITDTSLREELQKHGRARLQKFSWKKTANGIWRVMKAHL